MWTHNKWSCLYKVIPATFQKHQPSCYVALLHKKQHLNQSVITPRWPLIYIVLFQRFVSPLCGLINTVLSTLGGSSYTL